MGASGSHLHDTVCKVLREEPMNSLLSEEIRNLSYEEFIELLGEVNVLSKKCLDSNGYQLIFAVKKNTESTIFWKATVQIACLKFCPESQSIDTFRLLTLQEFLKVFKTLKCQLNAIEQCISAESSTNTPDLTVSTLFQQIDSLEHVKGRSECVICLERKPEVTLPCTHSYCTQCIEEWSAIKCTCPICRAQLDSPDDTWVMSEIPKADEITKEVRKNLMELTTEKKPPCDPS